jgi:hypothetical protein
MGSVWLKPWTWWAAKPSPSYPSTPRGWTVQQLQQEQRNDERAPEDMEWLRVGLVPPVRLNDGTVMLAHVAAARGRGHIVLQDLDAAVVVSAAAAPGVRVVVSRQKVFGDPVALRRCGVAAFGRKAWAATVPYIWVSLSFSHYSDDLLVRQDWTALQAQCAPHVDAQLQLVATLRHTPRKHPTVDDILVLRARVRECVKHGLRAGDPLVTCGGDSLLALLLPCLWQLVVVAAEVPAEECRARCNKDLTNSPVRSHVLALFAGSPLCICSLWEDAPAVRPSQCFTCGAGGPLWPWRPAAWAWAVAQ